MLNARDTTIDGITFSVGQLGYFKAQRLLPRIGKALGPALARGFKAVSASGDQGEIAEALALLFDQLTPDEFESIQRELFSAVTVGGEPLERVADVLLAGKPMTGLRVVAFALEVNFGSFSDVARRWVARAMAAAKTQAKADVPPSTSPST